jgi:hypothetical protein
MDCFVIQHHGDRPGEIVEVHLVEESASERVRELNQDSSSTFWWTRAKLKHRLLMGITDGKVTSAVAQALEQKDETSK